MNMDEKTESKSIIEREFFILEINKTNKNFRKYPEDVVNSWVENMDDLGYEVEFGVGMKPLDIQYEFIKSELVCGLLTEFRLEDGCLYGRVKFSTDGHKSQDIYSKKIELDECVIVPKGKAEVRDGIVQKNYRLYGFNLVHKNQSSFYFEKTPVTTAP